MKPNAESDCQKEQDLSDGSLSTTFTKKMGIPICNRWVPRLERGHPKSFSAYIQSNDMKIIRKTKNGTRREALLKEYFITASLIALLKRVGEEIANSAPTHAEVRQPAYAKIRH